MTRKVTTPPPGPLVAIHGLKKQPPTDAAARIEEYAADGFTVPGIAGKLGVAKSTLQNWMQENAELADALSRGRAKEEHALSKRLYRIAMESDDKAAVTACIFLLKGKFGWREGERPEEGNRVNITFNLPGAMSREDFLKTVVPAEVTRD